MKPANDPTSDSDAEDLRRLGYAQQLFREMGGFSNFAISFSIISILTGAVLLYGYGLKFAGPIINSVGWPIVSLFTLAVAASISCQGTCRRLAMRSGAMAAPGNVRSAA